jgi:pilus assembly protein Flp/PilA
MDTIKRFINDEQGVDLIEYALLAGLVSLAAVTALTGVGGAFTKLYDKITEQLGKLPGGGGGGAGQ